MRDAVGSFFTRKPDPAHALAIVDAANPKAPDREFDLGRAKSERIMRESPRVGGGN